MDDFDEFIGEIVVFNGVISNYNSIKEFVDEDDEIRLATEEEIERYYLANDDDVDNFLNN